MKQRNLWNSNTRTFFSLPSVHSDTCTVSTHFNLTPSLEWNKQKSFKQQCIIIILLTPSLPQPITFPSWKVHTYTTHANTIFHGPVTNLLSILCILYFDRNPFTCSCKGGWGGALMISNLVFLSVIFCGAASTAVRVLLTHPRWWTCSPKLLWCPINIPYKNTIHQTTSRVVSMDKILHFPNTLIIY